jgi:hypothetical protein
MTDNFRVTKDNSAQLEAALALLAKTKVMVGVPEDEAARDTGDITNAQLAYIHENGSPARNIPARPFLVPGVSSVQERIERRLLQAGQQAMQSNGLGAERALMAAGQEAVTGVRAMIDSNIPPPTQKALRAKRVLQSGVSRTKKQLERIMDDAESVALIDTGQLRASITYVLRKK